MNRQFVRDPAACCFAGLLALTAAVCAEDPCDAKPATAPKTYLPNSKGNPLAPTAADVSYGEHERNKLDFWQAKSETPTPVIMILHGGGWTSGSKANVSRSPRFPNLRAILGEGISVVAIDYRLIGKHTEGVMPPVKATLHDAARAVQFVRSKAREWNIDKERIASYGNSAGGCSSLWLAYHDDMADPKSEDPVARESTRLWCAAGSGAQTTLDPRQLQEWFGNPGYGGHAFGKYAYGKDFEKFLADREKLLPWIAEYSPWALVSAGDPPVYLSYGNKPPARGLGPDSTHGVTFGLGLQKRCSELGVECHVVYPGAPSLKYKSPIDYLVATLKAPAGASGFKLGSLFQDHVVLQRDMPIKVWGWAEKGTEVTVEFAGQKKAATTGKDGKWMVTLDPLPASSEGRELRCQVSGFRGQESGERGWPGRQCTDSRPLTPETITVRDVLVGEVWVCSGQSNMSYTMSRFGNCASEVPQMNYPFIRHFKVFRASRATPRKDVFGAWAVCSPETARRFSATALYYAVELHKALDVPIGLINSSVGGTNAQQWSDLATLEANPVNESVLLSRKERVAALEAASALSPDVITAYETALGKYLSVVGVNVALVNEQRERAFMNPDLSDAHWTEATLPASTGNGVAWFAREVKLPENMTGKELTLNVESAGRERTTYWNGVKLGPERSHTIPASLAKPTNSLAVRAAGIRGGGMSVAPSITGANGQTLSLGGNWKLHIYAKEPRLPGELSMGGTAAGLYNGMIAPLIPYAIRGVIWYQGENGPDGYTYRTVFPDMIKGWRKNWGQGDFPFYFCQLANYHPKQSAVAERHGWPLIREAQSMTLSLPNTGMACLIDVGKLGTYERDIHPANNQDQGKRLALIARDKIFGEDIVSSGPVFDALEIKVSKIDVKFKSVGSGLMRAGIKGWYDHTIIPLPTHPPGQAIHGFTIAGADGDFRMAHARILGKDTVEVWHPKVREPKHVRFAWHRNPLHNLYNIERLPAVPFRTDVIDLSAVDK